MKAAEKVEEKAIKKRKATIIALILASLIVFVLMSTRIFFFQSLPITVEKNGSLRDIVNALNLSGVAVLDDEVADISKLGDFQMLFIDNLWFQSKKMDNSTITWLKGHMLNGVPIIVFGPPEIDEDFLYSLANAQTRETTNHPIIAQGFYIKNERQSWLFIAGTELTQDKVKDAYNWALGEKK